jgi:beta-N-acetylhexosaminidase
MTAHVVYDGIDPGVPATLSAAVLTDLLRGQLRFEGVIASDDLGMKAVAERHDIEELALRAIAAGCDVLLIREPPEKQQRAFEALLHEAERSPAFQRRVEESAARVARLKAACRVGAPAPAAMLASRLGTPAHRALADSFVRRTPDAAPSSSVADT